jgi:hypothetical protein
MTLHYARAAYASSGKLTEVAGAVATSAMMTPHAVLAARGEWVTNEKRLLERAGLRDIDQLVAGLRADSRVLDQVIDEADGRFTEALTDAIR